MVCTRRAIAGVLLGLALATAGAATPTGPAQAAQSFADVPRTHEFYGDIEWLASQGIARGWADGTFRPQASISRGAFAAFMYRMADSPAFAASRQAFSDVDATHPFFREISWLASKGITRGWADGTFRPEEAIARDAMAAFLYRQSGSPATDGMTLFADVPAHHQFYREITWMAQQGISCGWSDGTFRPGQSTQRAAMAAFLHRFATGEKARCAARTYSITRVDVPFTVRQMATMQRQGSSIDAKKQYEAILAEIDPGGLQPGSPEYLRFADLRQSTGLTSAQINAFLASTPLGRSGNLAGLGYLFAEAAAETGLNEAYLVAHAVLESGWGSSQLAKGYYYDGKTAVGGKRYPSGTYYNFFGIGAVDSSSLSGGRAMAIVNGWNSRTKAIRGAAQWIAKNYVHRTDRYAQPTLYAMKWDYSRAAATGAYGWHQYASDERWPAKIAALMDRAYSTSGVSPRVRYIAPSYR